MAESTPRLAIIVSHPTQYYSPWFRALAHRTDVAICVFYLWDFGVTQTNDPRFGRSIKWDVDLLSGYSSVFAPNVARHPGAESFFGFRNPTLTKELKKWRADAVLLFGYAWESHLRAITWARFHGIPMIFRGDSHFIGRTRKFALATIFKSIIYRQFAAVTFVGAANKDYFLTLGVSPTRLFFAPHSVNKDLFVEGDPREKDRAQILRARLNISPNAKVVLFAGKMVSAKQPIELLEAFIEIAAPSAVLMFVGDGDLRKTLEARALKAAPGSVVFLPFANQSEMPSRYLAADIFVLPSRGHYETWGLAVNEAMHCGIPCLVSDQVGCQRDLVTDGETGWVFSASEKEKLRLSLQRAIVDVTSADRLSSLKAAIRVRISAYTFEQTSEGVVAALNAVVNRN